MKAFTQLNHYGTRFIIPGVYLHFIYVNSLQLVAITVTESYILKNENKEENWYSPPPMHIYIKHKVSFYSHQYLWKLLDSNSTVLYCKLQNLNYNNQKYNTVIKIRYLNMLKVLFKKVWAILMSVCVIMWTQKIKYYVLHYVS